MRLGRALIQANYPIPDDFVALARGWRADAIDRLFDFVWQGFDHLRPECQIDLGQVDENLERGITQLVCQRTRDAMAAELPFYLEHHPFEDETRKPAPAAPPAPDLAFILRSNPRASLPLEAKVLRTDQAVAKYVREIADNFLECRYAPFSSHGAMLGYLIYGVPSRAFESIAKRLKCELTPHPAFLDRDHSYSTHERTGEFCEHAPREFTCHHLMILFGSVEDSP